MTTERSKARDFLYSLAAALFVLAFLWFYADEPPYGPPNNELSDHSWGILVDIAHKWRDFSFSAWDRGVGGGTCLYSSGFYPIFHPTNVTAFFLNDDQFFKFKMIEPYVAGVFFGVFVLLQVFRLRIPFAVFGGMVYMGLGVSRFGTVADAPYFLWGCALFPLMVYALAELRHRNWSAASALAGCVLALQFYLEGASQFIQLFIWGLSFWAVYFCFFDRETPALKRIFRWAGASFLFVFFSLGLAALQFLPTYMFAFFESVRPYADQYQINNFPLFYPKPVEPKGTLLLYLHRSITEPGGVSWRMITALWLVAIGFAVTRKDDLAKVFSREILLKALCWGTVVCFFIPTVAGWLAGAAPIVSRYLKPLTYFTFAYSTHIIDFCMMLWLVLVLDHSDRGKAGAAKPLHYLTVITFILGSLFILLPVVMAIPAVQQSQVRYWPQSAYFIPANVKSALVVLLLGAVLLGYFYFRPYKKWLKVAAYSALVIAGFLAMLLGYNWNSKGNRDQAALFNFDSPEMRYYQKAAGKYYLPVDDLFSGRHDPQRKGVYPSGHNYNLLYDVHGTSGFLQVPALRFDQFLAAYRSDRMKTVKNWWVPKYVINDPGPEIPSRFPVDLTTVRKGEVLRWPGFVKKVDGRYYDIWERASSAERVYFGQTLKVVEFDDVIREFDRPRDGTIYVSKEDAQRFQLDNMSIVGAGKGSSRYSDFYSARGDMISFSIASPADTLVVVPEIFQSGWQVRVDGKTAEIFPADHLFIGFEAPKGRHEVTMRFVPPFLQLGSLISAMSLVLLGLVLYRLPRMAVKKA